MKWGYLVPRLLVVLVLWAFCQFGFDPTLRMAGEFGLETSSGRAVELTSVETQWWPPRLTATHLSVAEEDRLDEAEFQVGRLNVELDETALRHRRWVARDVRLEDVEWNVPAEFEAMEEHETDHDSDSSWGDGLREKGHAALEHQLGEMQSRLEEQLDPERFETVRLSQQLRTDYQQRVSELRERITWLQQQAAEYRQLADDPKARRQLLLQPERLETLVTNGRTIREQLRTTRDELTALKTHVPEDLQRLREAKDRDLAAVESDWQNLKSEPMEVVELLLGGPVADTLNHLAVWWPRWQTFHGSGQWKERHDAARRGRTIVFLPEQAGPDVGISHLLVIGRATTHGEQFPFRCELRDIVYPATHDRPATFQWASNGPVHLQAGGLVRLTDGRPEMSLQFRIEQTKAVVSHNRLAMKHDRQADVSFQSDATTIVGTLQLGDVIDGHCELFFPNARANVRTGDARLDTLLSAIDVNMAALTPTLDFHFADGHRDYDLACDGLSDTADTWKSQLQAVAREHAAGLRGKTEAYLSKQIAQVRLGGELDQLIAALPQSDLFDVAALKDRPLLDTIRRSEPFDKIRQTSGERMQRTARGLFDKIIR